MKRSYVIILLVSAFLCFGLMGMLYITSPLSKKIKAEMFIRELDKGMVDANSKTLDLGYNSYYIAGVTDSKIYLANYSAFLHLLSVDYNLTDSLHINIKFPFDSVGEAERCRVVVDSPFFYISNGATGMEMRGFVGEWQADTITGNNSIFFVDAVPMGLNSTAYKYISRDNREFELGKKVVGQNLQTNPELLQKQVDGYFSVDGHLMFSKKEDVVVYVHRYRNEIIIADTNLVARTRARTIDPYKKARIKVATLRDSTSTLASPPNVINARACVDGQFLYVQSNILSESETFADFDENSAIDIYTINDGRYIKSFYVPKVNGQSFSTFRVSENNLIAIYGNYLKVYPLKDM